ncbi:hypothetical protein B0H13DRAFT_2530900 [Mycena leptocephala]|nr:hypothetical protein B0H13DRAFT_2530900 [Mycena leptocephala]
MALGDSAKADQIAFHIYTKLFHVLYAARAAEQAPGPGQGKTDKWFNLETPLAPAASTPTLEFDAFRALSASPPPPPVSSVSAISTSAASASSSTASTSSLASDPATSRSSSTDESSADVLPPTIYYKNVISLFRALYTLLSILPAWRVVRKLTSRRAPLGAGGGPQDKRGLRPESGEAVRTGGNGRETTLSFGESPAPKAGAPPLPASTHVFPKIQHPAGESSTYAPTSPSNLLLFLSRDFLGFLVLSSWLSFLSWSPFNSLPLSFLAHISMFSACIVSLHSRHISRHLG